MKSIRKKNSNPEYQIEIENRYWPRGDPNILWPTEVELLIETHEGKN
jgi:hypothetical protein